MEPCELEFLGEKSQIGIIPNFGFDPIHLINGTIGPFRAGHPVHVPVWLAVHLRKQQKCRIVPPSWMDLELLEEIKEEEKLSRFFIKMPSEHYMVEAKLILGIAPEDVPHSEQIRTLIKDIWDIRAAKLRTSMDIIINGEGSYAKLDNLTLLEIHSVRPLLPHCLDLISRIERASTAASIRKTQNTSMLGSNTHTTSLRTSASTSATHNTTNSASFSSYNANQ